ncbi:uncharacterized protein LOC117065798 isoform X2 [Trachypithecus francoisi]|uniref:uncharacterized protein LOC117065798 isoform X2 n=1 Tax=Trachypithecus francoisi TaxID=54180 RepID=UPI00141B0FEE|nr:uncharacterized protein LOC117065798 isoform X2 [Trachypithecus francoisi]
MEKAVLARKPQRCLRRSVSLKGQGFQGEWPSLPNTERAQRTEELALPKHLRHVRHLTQPPFHLIISTNLHSRNSHSHFTEEMRTQAQEKISPEAVRSSFCPSYRLPGPETAGKKLNGHVRPASGKPLLQPATARAQSRHAGLPRSLSFHHSLRRGPEAQRRSWSTTRPAGGCSAAPASDLQPHRPPLLAGRSPLTVDKTAVTKSNFLLGRRQASPHVAS